MRDCDEVSRASMLLLASFFLALFECSANCVTSLHGTVVDPGAPSLPKS